MIQDGSSFAAKPALDRTFPGRFTTIEPAAVKVHATYSGFFDEVRAVQIAPDADAERPFLPQPSTLKARWLLADRGCPTVPYFEAVREQGGILSCGSRAATIRGCGPRGLTGVESTSPGASPVALAPSIRRLSPRPRCRVRT